MGFFSIFFQCDFIDESEVLQFCIYRSQKEKHYSLKPYLKKSGWIPQQKSDFKRCNFLFHLFLGFHKLWILGKSTHLFKPGVINLTPKTPVLNGEKSLRWRKRLRLSKRFADRFNRDFAEMTRSILKDRDGWGSLGRRLVKTYHEPNLETNS